MILKIYSGENHISHGIYESAYFYRGFPGFPGIKDGISISFGIPQISNPDPTRLT
jgi:hypothetical protein